MEQYVSDMRNVEWNKLDTLQERQAYLDSAPFPKHWFVILEGEKEGDVGIYKNPDKV